MRIYETLDSISGQLFGDYEHIIEDGCSNDGTLEVVDEFCKTHQNNHVIVYSEHDGGIYDAMNKALRRAKGDYICFLNAGDEFLDENTLSRVAECIKESPLGDVFYGGTITVFPDQTECSQVIALKEDDLCDPKNLESVNLHLIHQSMFARRSLFANAGFDCNYYLRAELEWYYRCFNSKKIFVRLPFPVCRYALGGVSESSRLAWKNIDETVDILNKYGYSPKRYLEGLQNSHLTKGVYKYIYNEWLSLKLGGRSMESYLLEKGINKIIVYGYGELGCHVIRELKNSRVEIISIIERDERYPYSRIPVKKPGELTGKESVDAMIVTAIMHYDEIYDSFRDLVSYPIISVEELLEDMWK